MNDRHLRSHHRVAVFQPCFSHYRKALFARLCGQRAPFPQYQLFHGRAIGDSSLRTLSAKDAFPDEPGLARRFHPIRNVFLGRKLCWQVGATRVALGSEFDTLVFEGNANILSTWVAAALARLRRKRVLFWSHGFLRNEGGLKGWLRTRFYRLAHGLLLYSRSSRENCLKKGFPPDQLYVVLNSLDHESHVRIRRSLRESDRAETRGRLFRSPDSPLLLWLGRLVPEKRLDLLLDSVHRLRAQGHAVNTLLIGDGPSRAGLEQQVHSLGLTDCVRFYGACYDEDVPGRLIGSADLCVGPGEMGLACIHAMTFGVPVVTHNCLEKTHQGPEIDAVIPGQTGGFYRHGDPEDLARMILAWLEKARTGAPIREACQWVVDNHFTPDHQVAVFNAAVEGTPAEAVIAEFSRESRFNSPPRRKEAA